MSLSEKNFSHESCVDTTYQVFTVEDFPYEMLDEIGNIKRGRRNHGGNRRKYKDIVCAFDIETTALEEYEQAVMYIWMFAVGKHHVVIGRTWAEFLDFTFKMQQHLGYEESFVIYVHNLSYEFQFMKGVYKFEPEEVFAVDRRKVLKCTMFVERLEFRCSYLQTNMSLADFTSKMNVEHQKLSGDDFDYKKRRYPWTEMTDKELQYCINDVIGLVESIEKELEYDSDNLETIPQTSTGYVRRDAKRSMRTFSKAWLTEMQPDYHVYTMLSEAFRGGNCHANRYYADRIVHNVLSFDRASSYPDVQCNCRYPMHSFKEFTKPTNDWLYKLMYEYDKAILMRVELTNVSLKKKWWGCPYIARHKCANIVGGVYDNGRVLSAHRLTLTITDIDYKIIEEEYNFGLNIIELYRAKYDMLPEQLRAVDIEYFKRKTELKGVEGQEVYYMKSKNKLNSVYGMCVQSPVKQSIDFIDGMFYERSDDERELLDRANRRAFLNYAWGVWTTAWARYRLEEGIRLVGNNFVYADTDSVKFVASCGDTTFDEYNKQRIEESKLNGAYAVDKHGVTQYMGVYEMDAHYEDFVTMGAKKYAYLNGDKINVTVAGVNKKKGGIELQENGGLEAFKTGFIFRKAGGTESIYNDFISTAVEIDGHTLPITANVYIKDSTYTLGLTAEYFNLIYKARSIERTTLKGE